MPCKVCNSDTIGPLCVDCECVKHAPYRAMGKYQELGTSVGRLVASKQDQYGDSVGKTVPILTALYPDGIPPHAYVDALLVVRVLDKLCRIAQRGADGQDRGGESPWRDLAGYSLLGLEKDGDE